MVPRKIPEHPLNPVEAPDLSPGARVQDPRLTRAKIEGF